MATATEGAKSKVFPPERSHTCTDAGTPSAPLCATFAPVRPERTESATRLEKLLLVSQQRARPSPGSLGRGKSLSGFYAVTDEGPLVTAQRCK